MVYNIVIKDAVYGDGVALSIMRGDAVVGVLFDGNVTVEIDQGALLQNCVVKGNLHVKARGCRSDVGKAKVEWCHVTGGLTYEGCVSFEYCRIDNKRE